jgi:hypothetical protein
VYEIDLSFWEISKTNEFAQLRVEPNSLLIQDRLKIQNLTITLNPQVLFKEEQKRLDIMNQSLF